MTPVQQRLPDPGDTHPGRSISPLLELGAYEELWAEDSATFARIAELFRANEGALPSDLVSAEKALKRARRVVELLREKGVASFDVRVHGAGEYPKKLRDARHPVELLYYQGWWDLVETRCVAVVGTRKPSPEACEQTHELVRRLVEEDWTIVSGLAAGIDTQAHRAALEGGGRTIAVLGTPLSETYPRENVELQRRLAEEFLVISQIPVCRHAGQDWRHNRFFFRERNVTMSALTEATIIVEAGKTSGTLIQARAALHQGRKLLILDGCFQKPDLEWPRRLAERGAIRVRAYADVSRALAPHTN